MEQRGTKWNGETQDRTESDHIERRVIRWNGEEPEGTGKLEGTERLEGTARIEGTERHHMERRGKRWNEG